MNKSIQYVVCLFFAFCVVRIGAADSLEGIWENPERFIEYRKNPDQAGSGSLRMVLKTYYRFVYDDLGDYPFTLAPAGHSPNIYRIAVRYPQVKKAAETSIWVSGNALFTSFYERLPYTENARAPDAYPAPSQSAGGTVSLNMLNGFWLESGHRNGILIYPQDTPPFLDAFFFMGGEYIQFRYWYGDLEYRQKQAEFRDMSGNGIAVPKLIRRGDAVYSCITGNGSKLKNYTKGTCSITGSAGSLRLTLHPQGGGPGAKAAGDTYPHHQYPRIENLPLYYDEKDKAFAFGTPFLTRSAVTDLTAETAAHNSLKRPAPEPLLKADELDFYWDRIRQIREKR
ncbi:MAG: hypothetical protein P1P65_09250 [Treponema sp.]